MKRKTLLEYASWKIISKYQDTSTGRVDGLWFNKMMSLLNTRLFQGKPKVDILLPRCWYFYGEEVVPKELPSQVKCEGLDEAGVRTRFCWTGDRPKLTAKRQKQRIDSAVNSLYSRFPPGGNVFDAVKAVYESAPFDFQRHYARFRSDFRLLSDVDIDGTFRATALYPKEFKRAMQSFPSEKFPELRVPAKKLECVVEAILEEFPSENMVAIDMAVNFWEIFCKFLRVTENKNVSERRVGYWRGISSTSLGEYREGFQKRVGEILSELGPEGLSDPMLLAFLQPINLGESFRHVSSEIDQVLYS